MRKGVTTCQSGWRCEITGDSLASAQGAKESLFYFPPGASSKAAEPIVAEKDAVQPYDGIAKRGKCAADLPVAAFTHGYLPVLALRVAKAHEGEFADAVVQGDAVIIDHLLVEWLELVVEVYFVDLGFDELRVRHLVRKVTVIRQEYDARAVFVEAANELETMELRG